MIAVSHLFENMPSGCPFISPIIPAARYHTFIAHGKDSIDILSIDFPCSDTGTR